MTNASNFWSLLNNMAVEPWNKIDIPYPSASAACRITFNTRTAALTEAVVEQCECVLKLLSSRVLCIETRVLHEILYVMNNGLRQHKPFRAIKQVQQCINRLKEMKLLEALQDLHELCPNQIQRNVGVDAGYCDIPSQPKLEWFCLKLLGASCLLCRTLDQCTKAFSLIRQHLNLSEFLVLNLVLASMQSRLWVFFRGILRNLLPLYQCIMDLLHEVKQCRPMAFLTDFTLPGDLALFLGSPYSELLKRRSTTEPFGIKQTSTPSLLDRIFTEGSHKEVEKEEEEEGRQMMQMPANKEMTSDIDLGRSIPRRCPPCSFEGPFSNLDKNTILQTSKQQTSEVVIRTRSRALSTSSLAALEQKSVFLKKMKAASSITDMTAHLEEMMAWCRRSKLYQESRYLAFMLLRCQKVKALENKGSSVQKTMRRLRVGVHHVMLKGTFLTRHSLFLQQGSKCYLRTRFATLMRLYGSVRSRFGRVRTRIDKDLFGVKSSNKRRRYTSVPALHKAVKAGSDVKFGQKESEIETKTGSLQSSRIVNDEIDHIFSSFGL